MLAHALFAAVHDIEAFPVEVEVNSGQSDNMIVTVGLQDAPLPFQIIQL
jgi:hypothetical protein